MEFFRALSSNFNIVTIILAGAFLLPILLGVATPFSRDKVRDSLGFLMRTLEWVAALFLAIYTARYLLANQEIQLWIYQMMPALKTIITTKTTLVHLFLILLLMLLFQCLLRIITIPVYRYLINPVSGGLSAVTQRMNVVVRQLFGGLWNLPKSLGLVFLLSLLLGIYCNYFNTSASFQTALNQSQAYQYMAENITGPLLSTDLATKIPVILSDSFRPEADEQSTDDSGNTLVIKYFNGMTLDEAVDSDGEINDAAKAIVGAAAGDKEKARLLYTWICGNVTYDDGKAEQLAAGSTGVSSGAIVTYQTRTGVCFDYSCLYVAMCRAVGVKVRFVTGLGYSGTYWGDHAWNQIYDPADDRWINVDATFGSSGLNYFDRPNFDADHKDSVVQQEWDSNS